MCSTKKVGAVGISSGTVARPAYPELRRAPVFSRLVSLSECLYVVSRSANSAKSNRQTPELERLVTRRKQTAARRSNRQNSHFCLARDLVVADARMEKFTTFLPGTASRVECDVTHSKQTAASFLPGATTPQFGSRILSRGAPRGLRQGTAFYAEPRSAAAPSLVWPDEGRCTQLHYSFRAALPARAFACTLDLASANAECAPFLTGSGLQTEFAVTHSKQTTETFLTGARIAFKQTRSRQTRVSNNPANYEVCSGRSSLAAAFPLSTGHLLALTQEGPLATDPYVKLIAKSMPARGKFIVLEGIDGSGKRTQLDMLARAFASRNVPFAQISFPRYDGFFGKLAARYLNGEFGSLEAVDANFSALLYAGDRFEAKPRIESDLASGKTLLADRYIGSNLAHQSARVPREKRAEFLQWLKQLEYQVYALPVEDLVIYLRVPPAEAHRLIGEKGAREYTKLQRDIQESNLAHLEATSEVYDQLARQPNWVKIECYDSAAKALRAPESIHQEILAAVQAQVTHTLKANK